MARSQSHRSGFEQRLLRQLRGLGVQPGSKVIVGFSGGADSLALALGLSRTSPAIDLHVKLHHVDHRLRPDSEDDIEQCRELASSIGLPFGASALEEGLAMRSTGIGFEEAARRERYQELANVSDEWGAAALVLAHQANDQAETILLHLVRGSGLDGLSGMRSCESRAVPWWDSNAGNRRELLILRPLLHETRDAIERYVESSGLRPIEDPSNMSLDFDRNWMRHRVIPQIIERWPGAIASMERAAETMQLDRSDLDARTDDLFQKSVDPGDTLRTDILMEATPAVAYRAVRRWLERLAGSDVGFDVVARVYSLASSGDEMRTVESGSGVSIVFANHHLTTLSSLEKDLCRDAPMVCMFGDLHWDVTIGAALEDSDAIVDVSEDQSVAVRPLNPGDRWWRTTRSVFDDLRIGKIHPLLRSKLLAVVAEDGVLLIPAIYPTMYGADVDEGVRSLGIRWRKQF